MKIFKPLTALAVTLALTVSMVGCFAQKTLAVLVSTLGTAAASVASVEGNTSLAQKLTTDVQTASTQILDWTPGTNAQVAVEAFTLVEDDLNLFPLNSKAIVLIDLAIGTVDSIITELAPASPVAAAAHASSRKVVLANAPKTSRQFKAQWNKLADADPSLAALHLK